MTEPTVTVPLGGRDVKMRKPTEGSLVVLARTFRNVSMIENVEVLTDDQRNRLVRNLGTFGKIVDAMIVQQDDKDWLEDAMIDGDVSAEQVFEVIRVAGEKFNEQEGKSTAKKAAAPVRRRR